jgi:hypothetical protein
MRNAIICLLLAAAVLAVFWQVYGFEFSAYDDQHYVQYNRIVGEGITLSGIWWAFTTGYFSYWHPLTWISHMLDVQLFGMNAGAHHLVSVFIHIVNSILLFFGLQYIAGSWQKSAFVAALFAVHPTHVESVAWIAERKDVLSGFFWILTIWAHGWYARHGGFWRYTTALSLFACGLMSKPMVVTLPCVLLLMDYWPLQRLTLASWKRVLLEKIPYLFGVLISCGVTLYGVIRAGSVVPDERFSLALRVANTPISYARYLGKLFALPHALALGTVEGDFIDTAGAGVDRCLPRARQTRSLPHCWLALVFGNAGADGRSDLRRTSVHRRPVHLHSVHWSVHHYSVGHAENPGPTGNSCRATAGLRYCQLAPGPALAKH